MNTTQTLTTAYGSYDFYSIRGIKGAEKLPYSLTILLENVLRNVKDEETANLYIQRILEAGLAGRQGGEIEYMPARVLLQDFTGVPVFVDFAVMREAARDLGVDPSKINPQIPLDLVIDHSVIADVAGCPHALDENMKMEFTRNGERYRFLKWAQGAFQNVRIVPPGVGICHQINVEHFATGVMTQEIASDDATQCSSRVAYFDTVVGTDSHTTTANGLGVLSWGVGGIEAEAAALGQPITTLVPQVVGMHITGELSEGVSAMDVALTFAQILRAKGVVGSFVECFGEGLNSLTATQRACISNMTPEYGCTCTLFPVDQATLDYYALTNRDEETIALVEAYAHEQNFWNETENDRVYADVIELDLSQIKRSISGPSRPHDRFDSDVAAEKVEAICADRSLSTEKTVEVTIAGDTHELTHSALAIAAVTSCTTATDPEMMLTCGLLAKHAVEAGLQAKPWVKRIMAPGSHATSLMLDEAHLSEPLSELGFNVCGFGCMSCIGNSGPILPEMKEIATDIELSAVLSGNRNFEGRISPDVSQNYLCAPAMVVAYSLVGTMDFNFEDTALATDAEGNDIFLKDIWPTKAEIAAVLDQYCTADVFERGNANLMEGTQSWRDLEVEQGDIFAWDEDSTYVRHAPYFDGMTLDIPEEAPIKDAVVLAKLGDFITTDHISPAGSIAQDAPAAEYLRERNVPEKLFNTYGSRRGNHEVMMRGTFANVKLLNDLADGRRGGWTQDMTTQEIAPIFNATENYKEQGLDSVVLAGKMYGSGSSRDWAAKGPMLIGVRAVFAESFERIHRSNLIGMGVLPLQFEEGQNAEALGLDGTERINIGSVDFTEGLPKPAKVSVSACKQNGETVDFSAIVRVDTPTEGAYMYNGGILQYVLRQLALK